MYSKRALFSGIIAKQGLVYVPSIIGGYPTDLPERMVQDIKRSKIQSDAAMRRCCDKPGASVFCDEW